MQRREFLTAGAASATLAVVGTQGAGAGWGRDVPAALSRAQFSGWMNQRFRILAQGTLRGHTATLVAVTDGPARPGLSQFRVSFRGASPLPSGLCLLEHAGGRCFLLHLEPASGAEASTLRHATFALLEKADV
jgi:hypothetical protein